MSGDIQTLKVARLLPDPENVNQHNDINIAQIKASIERFGFLDPLGVVPHETRRGYFTIVEGHGRYEAALLLELVDLPCFVLTLTEAHRKGYAIAHNQTQHISVMDHRAVALEFERLHVAADDYISLGYTAEDVLFLPGMGGGTGTGGGGDYHHHEAGEGAGTVETGAGEAAGETASAGGFAPAVHRTTLTFATDQSYNRFVHILTTLRGRYPTAGTIGERLALLLGDMGVAHAEGA